MNKMLFENWQLNAIFPEYSEIINEISFSEYKNNISPYIRFHITNKYPEPTVSLIGGDSLYILNGNKLEQWGTIGFCGTYLTEMGTRMNCVLTAGHVLKTTKELYYQPNNPAGNNTVLPGMNPIIQFADHQNGDYGLLHTGQNVLTNLIRLNTTTTGKISSIYSGDDYQLFEGRIVYKYGAVTGLTAGTVMNFNTPVTYELTKILGLTSFMNSSITIAKGGDSGGPVWYIKGDGTRQLYGVLSGVENGNDRMGYFSRLAYPCQNNSYIPKLN